MRKLVFGIAISFALVLAACSGGGGAVDPTDIGDPVRGEEIFNNGTETIHTRCTQCHTLDPNEEPDRAPSLVGISEAAGTRVEGQSAVDYLRESIVEPGAYIVEGWEDGMDRAYKYGFSEEDVNNVVAFLLTQ